METFIHPQTSQYNTADILTIEWKLCSHKTVSLLLCNLDLGTSKNCWSAEPRALEGVWKCRSQTMERVIDIEKKFEVNAVADGKPVGWRENRVVNSRFLVQLRRWAATCLISWLTLVYKAFQSSSSWLTLSRSLGTGGPWSWLGFWGGGRCSQPLCWSVSQSWRCDVRG